ncbi:MAG: hypothetical protein ACLFNU_07625 [Bacteroidales bacterium]
MKLSKAILLLIFGLSFFVFSCTEEEPTIVPDVYVNFSINLDLPQYNSLKSIQNSIIERNRGYDDNGVIVYRYSHEDFLAFDATCPQHITKSVAVVLDEEGTSGTATCPHCETTYSFFNFGQADSGHPLKRYQATFQGMFVQVSN